MPIDFEAIVAPFRVQFFLQRRTINQVFEDLGKLFAARKREVEARELATQNLPVYFFSGEALSVWLDASQHGALALDAGPPKPISWDDVAAPFEAFYAGILTAETMVRSEWVLPGSLGALAAGVHLIAASIERYKEPTSKMFDVQAKRPASDLFGQVALFFRLLDDPATAIQVNTFVRGILEMREVLNKLFPAAPKGQGTDLAEASLAVGGAALLVPLGARLLENIGEEMQLAFQLRLLERFRAIEEDVFRLRRSIIDFFYVDLRKMGRGILEWLQVSQAVTACSLNFYDRVLREYLDEVTKWLHTVGPALKEFGDKLVKLLDALGPYSEKLLDMDIGSALTYGTILFSDIGSLRLGDLNDPEKLQALIDWVNDKEGDLGILGLPVAGRIQALKEVLSIAKGATQLPLAPEATLPDVSKLAQFPSFYDAFFGTGALDLPDSAKRMSEAGKNAETLGNAFTNLGKAAKTNVDTILTTGVEGLRKVSERFSRGGTMAAELGSAARYREVIRRSSDLADTVVNWKEYQDSFQPHRDPVAEAMESWLADSHFALLSRTLPLYVAEMLDYWREQTKKPPVEQPTSPHILARRARVDRVRVPRITLNVEGERTLDKSLALEVATQFQGAVAQAFQAGLEQYGATGG
jgi:hypothetical protein